MNFIHLQIRQLCKRIHEYCLKLSKMYANKRYLSESSSEDVDDPDGVSDSNENDHDNNVNGGYTASYKRPRISRDSQSTEDEQAELVKGFMLL